MEKFLLEELMSVGAVSTVSVKSVAGGFVLIAQTEGGERLLETQRGRTRVFSKLDTAAHFLSELGLTHFIVDLGNCAETPKRCASDVRIDKKKQSAC